MPPQTPMSHIAVPTGFFLCTCCDARAYFAPAFHAPHCCLPAAALPPLPRCRATTTAHLLHFRLLLRAARAAARCACSAAARYAPLLPPLHCSACLLPACPRRARCCLPLRALYLPLRILLRWMNKPAACHRLATSSWCLPTPTAATVRRVPPLTKAYRV